MSEEKAAGAMPVEASKYGDDFKLPIDGFKGTPEEVERLWFETVYKGRGDSMPQLTWRAVLMGSVLGGVLSLTNLYIGLKSGWGFGVAITAAILSYSIWTTFHKLGWVRTPMTILENNCMQSTASAAGYSTGTTLVSAFSAFILINGKPLPVGPYPGLGLLSSSARGHYGHSHEKANDQCGAASVSDRGSRSGDLAKRFTRMVRRECVRPRLWVWPGCWRPSASS